MVIDPMVIPVGAEECQPTVEIELTIDGKPLKLKKVQKYKTKEVDGKITSSANNTFYINDVEKTQRDYIADLKNRGIDTDNFLMFSHPNAFMADTSKKGREEMRSILFKMCEDVSDEQIASEMSGIEELKALLENYSLDECEQINKATLKKINEEAGKDNSLYRARIEELIGQKSNQDKKVLEEQKSNYESEIERIEQKLADLSSGKADISNKLSKIKIERDKVVLEANSELNSKKVELDKEYRTIQSALNEHSWQLNMAQAEKRRLEEKLSNLNEDLKKQRTLYKTEQGSRLDESDRYCPTCHREFEPDKLKKIKDDFEAHKAERLKTVKTSGESIKTEIDEIKAQISEIDIKISKYEKLVAESQAQFDKCNAELNKLPASVDLSKNEEYTKLSEKIAELESELSTDDNKLIEELTSQKNVNKQMLSQINGELAVLEKNIEIDKRISEIRKAQKDAEIRRADAEKVLDQVDRFKRFKNDKLTESINSKFSLVKWKLYDFQRNGEIKDVCIPLIDNKPMDNCCNGSLITLCKISICADLQRNFQQFVPIWVEDYSLFSSNTESRLNADSQIIGLVVTEDDELKVEGE
jgi:DNA repair exonuclease SbcCD ATPase subunit